MTRTAGEAVTTDHVLEAEGLRTAFATPAGPLVVVDDVSFRVRPGQILGLVGESGSGKTMTALSLLGLLPPGASVSGRVCLGGHDLLAMSAEELRKVRGGRIGMIFQDPMSSLNPVLTVGRQIAEGLRAHNPGMRRQTIAARVIELLTLVGIPDPRSRVCQYPHEFSGGMRQRVMIAIAIANEPELLIADEPTTALDVTVQAQILDLLDLARTQTNAATILISHDLGVVAELADRVCVMYGGRVVETGAVRQVFADPAHPYTRGLLASSPRLGQRAQRLRAIRGQPPDLARLPVGCAFEPRCDLGAGREICQRVRPGLLELGPDRRAACHFAGEVTDARTA